MAWAHAPPAPSARATAAAAGGRAVGVAFVAVLLLAGVAPTVRAQLAQDFTLVRYTNSKCTRFDTGQGSTQSWTLVLGATGCFELMTGYQCDYRCLYKLGCQYETGSGVILSEMTRDDVLSCQGTPKSVRPFADHLYWTQAEDLFTGGCVPDGAGKYLKFDVPLDEEHWPNCSSYGEVEPGAAGGAAQYDATYTLQFYSDLDCQDEYQVSTFGERPTSRFDFKLYRGAQHCYDQVDMTPRGNVSSRDIGYDLLNWRIVCGNVDSKGNGLVIQFHDGLKCTGGVSAVETWQDMFYPMNYPDTMDFLSGKCTPWGLYRVKFLTPWDPMHFPDCESWSCKDGACSGGRVKDPSDTVGTLYSSDIRTSGGNPADPTSVAARSPATAAARRAAAPFAASVLAPAAAMAVAAAVVSTAAQSA